MKSINNALKKNRSDYENDKYGNDQGSHYIDVSVYKIMGYTIENAF